MHLPIDNVLLARVVSTKLTGNENEYAYQEDCGSSDTTSYFKLVKRNDVHRHVLVGVNTSIPVDEFEKSLLERRFEQNITFINQMNANDPHPLCPVILATNKPSVDFAYSWVAYEHVEGWPLASTWHQLKPEIRMTVVENIAIFVRELALIRHVYAPNRNKTPSIGYVGSINEEHILFPPTLATNSAYWKNESELSNVASYADLITLLAESRATMHDHRTHDAGTKSIVAEEIRAIIPVAHAILSQHTQTVLAHANLLPQNIWIDPFTGKVVAVFGWEYAHYAPLWMVTSPLGWLMDEKKDWMLESEKLADPWAVWRPHFDHPSENTAKEMRGLRDVWNRALQLKEEYNVLADSKEEEDNLSRTANKICFAKEEKLPKVIDWCRDVVSPSASIWMRMPLWSMLRTFLVLAAAGLAIAYYTAPFADQLGEMATLFIAAIPLLSLQWTWGRGWSTQTSLGSCNGDKSSSIIEFQPRMANSTLKRIKGISHRRRLPWIYGYGKDTSGNDGTKDLSALPCSPANSIIPSGIYVPNLLSRAATMMSRAPTALE